jgi:hypothetical protein
VGLRNKAPIKLTNRKMLALRGIENMAFVSELS